MTHPLLQPSTEELADRLGVIRSRITELGGQRVTVVAVTKTHPSSVVQTARAAGIEDLGENYAQEMIAKAEPFGENQPRWHFMGQLQRNKVGKLSPYVFMWQSVDSSSLAASIARHAPGAAVLLQVNLDGAENRGGVQWAELDGLQAAAVDAGLAVRGLMGVASMDDEATVRTSFRRLRSEADQRNLPQVSMGMSNDYELAVQEGSTMVRLGTALFGSRTPRG